MIGSANAGAAINPSPRTAATTRFIASSVCSTSPRTLDPKPMDARTIADPIPLAQALMRCPSVTPTEAGVLDVAQRELQGLGFSVRRLKYGLVDNLYARLGDAQPNFCFAGHLDVVPPGDGWASDPFAADIRNGNLYG